MFNKMLIKNKSNNIDGDDRVSDNVNKSAPSEEGERLFGNE
jgi:hypothetical protein